MSDISNRLNRRAGAWLPWRVVETLLRLRLRPCSHWQVYLAVLLTSARYNGNDAKLGIDDICSMTGLSPRAVKGAVITLCKSGLLVRPRRARLLRVPLLHSAKIIGHHRSPFTRKQDATIASILSKIMVLRGIDGLSLIIPSEFADRLGLSGQVSYAQAYEELKSTGTRALAGIFVESIIALYNDKSIQGKELL